MICGCNIIVHCPVNNPVTCLNNLSEGLPMKNYDCLISGAAAQCLECLSCTYSLTVTLQTHGEVEIADFWLRNALLSPSLVKASVSSLPWIRQWSGTLRSVTFFHISRAHIACQHFQTSFGFTLSASSTCIAAWPSEHTQMPSPVLALHFFAQAKIKKMYVQNCVAWAWWWCISTHIAPSHTVPLSCTWAHRW
jgi:hypothetical protein